MTGKVDFEVGNMRLRALAAILNTADEVHRALEEPTYRQTAWQHRCGTPACALGHWAAANPGGWKFYCEHGYKSGIPVLRNGEHSGIYAAAIDFGLTHDEAREIFGMRGCNSAATAKDAANYILDFVRRREAEKMATDAAVARVQAAEKLRQECIAAEAKAEAARKARIDAARNSVGRRRLLELAIYLDRADELHQLREEPTYCQFSFAHPCGTPACALGHWAFNNWSRWELKHTANGVNYARLREKSRGTSLLDAEREFEITTVEAHNLFEVGGCGRAKSATDAAAFIRAFVDKKWGPTA